MIGVVLDTNVVLDLWVFGDAGAQPLRDALDAGRLAPLASEETDAELGEVLARPQFGLTQDAQARLLDRWRAVARQLDRVFPAPWQCTDAKDQPFLDLAFTARASALITRDKALLRLARKTRPVGLAIVRPSDFAPV